MTNAEFSIVQPSEYRLFQAADLACTLELIRSKNINKSISSSEKDFFVSAKRLKKTYFRRFKQKRFHQSYTHHLYFGAKNGAKAMTAIDLYWHLFPFETGDRNHRFGFEFYPRRSILANLF